MHIPFFRPVVLSAAIFVVSAMPAHAGMDPYIGEMMLFASAFPQGQGCPRGWLKADGSSLSMSNYAALYALIGITYGGGGQNTFNLPDMRGRVPVGMGQGPGLQNIVGGVQGQGGSETVHLTQNHLPAHTHALSASPLPATHATPAASRIPAQAQNAGVYGASDPATNVTTLTGSTGTNMPVSVRDPYLAMNWCIAVEGIFPTPN